MLKPKFISFIFFFKKFWLFTTIKEKLDWKLSDQKQIFKFVAVLQSLSNVPLLPPHGLQHTRLPWPWLSPEICRNSCPLSWWYHLDVGGVCNFLGSVSSQQKFEASDQRYSPQMTSVTAPRYTSVLFRK